MSKLICITGIDGAGKSTLINSVSSLIPSVYVANIWDITEGGISNIPFGSKKDIDDYLCALTPDSRLLFLAHALKFSVDKALGSGKEIILLNGYYYKYFATELALKADKTLIYSLIKTFPVPHRLIFLDIPIEQAGERKLKFSRYETGLSTHPDKKNFIDFQKLCLNQWDVFDKTKWNYINATQPPHDLLKETMTLINR